MPDDGAGKLIKQYEAIAGERGTWESSWQDIADHILGHRDFNTQVTTGGRRRMHTIYDTTALLSVSLLSGGMHSLLTNPAAEWFHIKPQDDRLMEDREVAIWFEDAENQMYNAFNRPQSRFSSQMHEMYIDWVSFCTGGFYIGDRPGRGIMFSSRPLSELFVAEDEEGVIDTVFRKFQYTALQAVEAWGDAAPKKAKDAIDKNQHQQKSDYLHVVRPAESPLPIPFELSGMPFDGFYVSIEEKRTLSRGGYREMPYMVPRWEKDSGESYGRGPGFTALPDAMMLNQMKKTLLQTGVLKVRPPIVTDDDEATVDLRPGGKMVTRTNAKFESLEIGGDLGWGDWLLKSTREQVQQAFHWEILQMIRDPRMTATQVLELSAHVQRLLAPVLGRAHSELLHPIISRTYGILARGGYFLPAPPALVGQPVKVEYVSPVARAQKDGDAKAIVDLFTVGANLAQVDPKVLDIMDSDEAMRFIGAQKGVPIRVLRSREDVQAIREERMQEQERQMQREEALQGAETAAKVLPALREKGIA